MMSGLLTGQKAVVFGGSSGLGKAVAVAMAAQGAAAIVIADLQEAPREGGQTACEVIAAGHPAAAAHFVHCDVRSESQVADVMDQAELLGPTDIVVNTAAVYWHSRLVQTDIAELDRMLAVNVRGAFLVAQAAARRMIPRGRGVIINTGSGAGLRGAPTASAYAASKGALRLMTYSLAAELGPYGLRVNQVDPAYMDTAMTRVDVPVVGRAEGENLVRTMIPLRRMSALEEVADAFVYLASPMASYVTGHCLAVDGGNFTSVPDLDALCRTTS